MIPYIHPLAGLAGAYWLPWVAATEATLVFWGWRWR
jgi:hypothetical protein